MIITQENILEIDFDKGRGLVPAIIQDNTTKEVLMQGYMNNEALTKTLEIGRVTFFSRSKKRLWTKGESSRNYLNLVSIQSDCDRDCLLVKVNPIGPVCHTGTDTCWGGKNKGEFLNQLEKVIQKRRDSPSATSYTSSLFAKGINKVAQKVGEEAVELVIEAKDNNKDLFLNEAADLLYHYLVLLAAKRYNLEEVRDILRDRHSIK